MERTRIHRARKVLGILPSELPNSSGPQAKQRLSWTRMAPGTVPGARRNRGAPWAWRPCRRASLRVWSATSIFVFFDSFRFFSILFNLFSCSSPRIRRASRLLALGLLAGLVQQCGHVPKRHHRLPEKHETSRNIETSQNTKTALRTKDTRLETVSI